jgi:cell division inhibitor SepF
VDHIFTKLGSSVDLNNSGNGQIEYSAINNVIPLFGTANVIPQVVVMKPCCFEEMPQAIQALRERKVVVLNMTVFDPEQAQRAIDFVAGATYAIDGHPQRISEQTFLFAPSCVFLTFSPV